MKRRDMQAVNTEPNQAVERIKDYLSESPRARRTLGLELRMRSIWRSCSMHGA